jgi:hypothetical protein
VGREETRIAPNQGRSGLLRAEGLAAANFVFVKNDAIVKISAASVGVEASAGNMAVN